MYLWFLACANIQNKESTRRYISKSAVYSNDEHPIATKFGGDDTMYHLIGTWNLQKSIGTFKSSKPFVNQQP